MYKDIFTQIGLTDNEAIIYEYLIKNGETAAGKIIKNTPLKRGVVYYVLDDLVKKGLINERKKEKVAYFMPVHPQKLEEIAEDRENELKKAKNALEANMGKILSDFNLLSNQPGIKYFEGMIGIKKVLEDTLKNNPTKEILSFVDAGIYAKYLSKWNAEYYAPKRRELGIFEKVIIPKNETSLEFMNEYMKNPKAKELTDVIFVDQKFLSLIPSEINIYGGDKICFVTFSEKGHMAAIVQNKEIASALASIFNCVWQLWQIYESSILTPSR
ncbi:MAG: helix-turn-helix domain-containing protein [bacterium]